MPVSFHATEACCTCSGSALPSSDVCPLPSFLSQATTRSCLEIQNPNTQPNKAPLPLWCREVAPTLIIKLKLRH